MQNPLPITFAYEDAKAISALAFGLLIMLFLILLSVFYLIYRADKIGKDVKTIRSLTAAGLQAETPEARRMAASIHNTTDEN